MGPPFRLRPPGFGGHCRLAAAQQSTFPLNALCVLVGRAMPLAARDCVAGGGLGDDGLGGFDFAFEAADCQSVLRNRRARKAATDDRESRRWRS